MVVLKPKLEGGERPEPTKVVFEKPAEGMSQYLRSLYINAAIDGVPYSRILIDNGAVVNNIAFHYVTKNASGRERVNSNRNDRLWLQRDTDEN